MKMTQGKVLEMAEELDQDKMAAVAGMILSNVDPNRENLLAFWKALTIQTRDELVARISEFDDVDFQE